MFKRLNIIYLLIVLAGAALFYIFNYAENFFSFLAIITFGYTVVILRKNKKITNAVDNKFENSKTLIIVQLIFLLIAIGLRLLVVIGKQDVQLMTVLQMAVVLVLMNSIIMHAEAKIKQRHANNIKK